jgi:Tol biopolymer transport system component
VSRRFVVSTIILAIAAWLAAAGTPGPAQAMFPGANGLIVFTRFGAPDYLGDIYTMNSNGTNVTRLTFGPNSSGTPRWSPDGTKIAFFSYRDWETTEGTSEIYVMNADGSNIVRLTNNTVLDNSPGWSPDGTKIAFASTTQNSSYDVYVMNADGTDRVRLTTDPGQDDSPAWSPDGTKILFRSDRSTGYNEIWVMNADGTDQHSLISNTPPSVGSSDWKPDGSKIVFGQLFTGVWVADADGSNPTKLIEDGNPGDDADYPTMDPVWSPHGMRIALARRPPQRPDTDIWVMNPDGSGVTNITDEPATNDINPDWQPLPAKRGDADCNGSVDAVDALMDLRYVAGLSSNGCVPVAGNVKCDDGVDAVDALFILRFVAGLPVTLPQNCPEIGT